MNFKRFSTSDNQWHSIPYYTHKTATDTLTLPATLYPNDTTITVGLKGNEEHTGTPSPQNPVIPNGCGERTAQLFDKTTVLADKYVSDTTGAVQTGSAYTDTNVSDLIDISGLEYVYISTGGVTGRRQWGAFYDSSEQFVEGLSGYNRYKAIPQTAKYLRLTVVDECLDTLTVISGTTAPTIYEPYGYKISISSAGQTTPVYLGGVQTVRQIKKYAFTGVENFSRDAAYNRFILTLQDAKIEGLRLTQVYCTNFTSVYDGRPVSDVPNNAIYSSDAATNLFFIKTTDYTDVPTFKAWLAQQYANGTPVTVWYVLATPQTATVNEPLMRIGDYADSLTTSIPVTAGENTLDVQTTVQPSEVSAGFSGWHPITEVHERENGQ